MQILLSLPPAWSLSGFKLVPKSPQTLLLPFFGFPPHIPEKPSFLYQLEDFCLSSSFFCMRVFFWGIYPNRSLLYHTWCFLSRLVWWLCCLPASSGGLGVHSTKSISMLPCRWLLATWLWLEFLLRGYPLCRFTACGLHVLLVVHFLLGKRVWFLSFIICNCGLSRAGVLNQALIPNCLTCFCSANLQLDPPSALCFPMFDS